MKKYLTSSVLFALPILVLFLFLEIYNRTRPANEIIAKQHLLTSKKDVVDYLIVGNSHGRDGINPLELSPNAVNACIGGNTLFYVRHFLEKNLDELPNCRHIILNVSYQTLYYDMDSLPDTRKKYEFFHYMGAAYHLDEFSFSRYSLLYAISFSGAMDNLLKDVRGKGSDYTSFVGYTAGKSAIRPESADELSKERVSRHHILMNEGMLGENLGYLGGIIDLAEKRNIQLTLVTTPVSPTYKAYEKPEFKKFHTILASLAAENSFQYLDYSTDKDFKLEYFIDPDHLNQAGGDLLSDKIKRAVTNSSEI